MFKDRYIKCIYDMWVQELINYYNNILLTTQEHMTNIIAFQNIKPFYHVSKMCPNC